MACVKDMVKRFSRMTSLQLDDFLKIFFKVLKKIAGLSKEKHDDKKLAVIHIHIFIIKYIAIYILLFA